MSIVKNKLGLTFLFLFLCGWIAGCGSSGSGAGSGTGGGSSSNPGTQATRFKITNQCADTIWIQQSNMPSGTAEVAELSTGASIDYDIPDAGLASTRFWAKSGCDANGENCTIGQSSNPCPAAGCAPPVDSKIEVTWGCILSDQSQCAYTPQGQQLSTTTFYNASAVDGYTFPYQVTVTSNGGNTCNDLNCSTLLLDQCPTDENLSQGLGEVDPQYASENLQVLDDSVASGALGCYSPCKKFNYPTYDGLDLPETSDEAVLYCCPTPPISSAECQAGPVATTQYVDLIHQQCSGGVYGYAYDDGVGLHTCTASTKIEMIFGPNCP